VAATEGVKKAIRLEFCNQRSNPAEIRLGYASKSEMDFTEAKRLASLADVVIFCGGLDGSLEYEGHDRPFTLPFGQDQLIEELAAVNPNTIVALHAGGGVDMSRWADKVAGIFHLLYPGQEGGRALAELLSGKAAPSGRLPFTIERRWEDSPACGNYDETRKERKVYYREGIFTGYRGYEKKNVTPLFPFGYGLTYTTFDYSNLTIKNIDKKTSTVTVTVDVKNTGSRQGAEVVQLYVSQVSPGEERPAKELKNFAKVVLNPQEVRTVEMTLPKEAFQYYNDKKGRWVLEKGNFDILVGASSQDIKLNKRIKI
jgi:beta-glucosidase